MGGFEQGFQFGQDQQQRREASDMMQRKFLADQYQNYANNIRLPDATQDPEGYKKALDLKQQALDAMQKVYSPDHHATLAEHIHGLIFGPKKAQGTPQSSQAPQVSAIPGDVFPASAYKPIDGTPPVDPKGGHPMKYHPEYQKIIHGLDALGAHLKASVHPNGPKQPLPALTRFATVPNDSELTAQDAAKKFQQEEELLKLKNQGAIEVAKAKTKLPTEQQRFLDSYAVKIKKPIDDWTPEDFEAANKEYRASVVAGVRPSQAALATYIRAKFGENPTAEQIAQGTREHQALMAGQTVGNHQQLVFDDSGIPHIVTLHSESGKQFNAPVSNQAPSAPGDTSQLAATNAAIQNGNATSKKLNKGKPVSVKAPSDLNFTKGNPLVKSDAAQYTKVAEDATTKQVAYQSAAQAAQSPTPTSDTELIYSWVRSNVQGAGKMSQAEFKQAGGIGSVPLKAENWASLATSGLMTPKLRQYMLADIKRSADTSQAQADNLRKRIAPVSSQAPQSGGKMIYYNIVNGVLVPE